MGEIFRYRKNGEIVAVGRARVPLRGSRKPARASTVAKVCLDMRHASKELSLNGLQARQLLFCTDLRDQGVVKHLELWRELGVERAIALLLEAKDVENAAEHFLFCLG